VAILMVVSIIISTLGTHHRIPLLHKPVARKIGFMTALKDVAATLNNWNFGVAVVAGVIAGMGSGLYSGMAIYLDTFFWELPARGVGYLVLTQLLASFFSAFVATWLARKIGKKRACMALFFGSVVTNGGPILLRLLGFFPENGSDALMPLLMAGRFVTGILGPGGFIVVTSMIADITEEAQAKTGRRSEGLLRSADSILNKTASSLSAMLPGLLLAFVEFPAKAKPGMVDPEIIRNMAMIYLPATAGISTLSISVWGFYRIDQAKHEKNLAEGKAAAEAFAAAEARREALDAPPA
jgi:Na+/melibiose symporter-like transporter